MLEYREHITRAMLQAEPNTLFVFGDNLERRGYGGQAKEMRGEPNAVGIPTKRAPSMQEWAFLQDVDLSTWSRASAGDFNTIRDHLGPIVWPAAGIGTGLAQLQTRAPLIWERIEKFRLLMEKV